MEVTEEQKKRAEANRLAAIEKRKRAAEERGDVWKLFKCRKISSPPLPEISGPKALPRLCVQFVLEMCSLDEFSIIPKPVPDCPFPGELECFQMIESCLSLAPLRCIQSQIGKKAVFQLEDYEMVSGNLKRFKDSKLQEIPYKTRKVIEKCSGNRGHHWIPFLPHHLPDIEVDRLICGLPKSIRDALLPFQLEGIRFGLRRGGRCLIADEMGLGKTLQAIAIASCFMNEGTILVVCPALLRYSWAEEMEHWLPLLPKDIHLIFGHQNNLDRLDITPKVVVISFTMLHRLRRSMLERKWALMIVDESHNIRCTKKKRESGETETVLDVAAKTERIVLLSGTPSLSRPFDIFHQINILWPMLLGNDKYEFASNYCSPLVVRGSNGAVYMDYSRGIRLDELNLLLSQTLMIRRLKEHVMTQLPPKRRQIIRMKLKDSDISLAVAACGRDVPSTDNHSRCKSLGSSSIKNDNIENGSSNESSSKELYQRASNRNILKELSFQELGIAKLSGFREWFSDRNFVNDFDDAGISDIACPSHKMIIFAHHLKVLDGIQEFLCEKEIKFARIDGSTSPRDRQVAVETFRNSKEVKIVIIGITAGGVGLDFSAAQSVVFLELPKSASEMLQAEDRAHRRGQSNAVNVYIFCAKDTSDESHWLQLNRSLYRVSSMMNGKVNAIKSIEVESVSYLDDLRTSLQYQNGQVIHNVTPIKLIDHDSEARFCDKYDHEDRDDMNIESSSMSTSELSNSKVGDSSFGVGNNTLCEHLGNDCSVAIDGTANAQSCSNLNDKNGDSQYMKESNCVTHEKLSDSPVTEHGENYSVQAESLRFEVSQFTGRIHLYVCTLQTDSRPMPLFENFRPEDLESMAFAFEGQEKKQSFQTVKDNPAFWSLFRTFIKEWNDLRPVEKNKLLGKPLRLPLHLELCYVKESVNHGCGGLLKGGSKRRATPWSEFSNNLPVDAVWKKITLNSGTRKETECIQAWSLADNPLCKLCLNPCVGKLAKTPQYFEDLFCNLDCLEEYRLRTSGRLLRAALFQLEHGVCTTCKLDCHSLIQSLRPLSIERRRAYVKRMAPRIASNESMLEKIVYEPVEGNAWHADHVVPVYRGGGECRLENMRTLCVACHSDVTKAQQADRRLTRTRAKEQLKLFMKDLRDKAGECGQATEEHEEVDDLLIHVPGSLYSNIGKAASETPF